MDLEVVEKEVASWAPEDQDRLAVYLTVLRLKRSSDHIQELTRRLDDRDPDNWVSLDEVRSLRKNQMLPDAVDLMSLYGIVNPSVKGTTLADMGEATRRGAAKG